MLGALHNNATGSNNTANGQRSLYDNLSGSRNTANGSGALVNNTMGDDNTANGFQALANMLLNEFLKEHREVRDLKSIVTEQQKQIETLTAGLQKISAQVEQSRPRARTVATNQ